MSERVYEGGCHCGAVRYCAGGDPLYLCFCHCESCRGSCGAPMVAWGTFDAARFSFVEGEPVVYVSSEPVERTFCANCGTSLTYAHSGREGQVDVTLASLDDRAALSPQFHVWVSQKLPWILLEDGLPQFPEWPTG